MFRKPAYVRELYLFDVISIGIRVCWRSKVTFLEITHSPLDADARGFAAKCGASDDLKTSQSSRCVAGNTTLMAVCQLYIP